MAETLDLDAIERRHAPRMAEYAVGICQECGVLLPCTTVRLMAEVRRLRADIVERDERAEGLWQQNARLRAVAERAKRLCEEGEAGNLLPLIDLIAALEADHEW